jgi:serine/threonine-protein kinase
MALSCCRMGAGCCLRWAETANWDEAHIVAQALDTGTRTTLISGGTDGRYLPTGHLVYALRDMLLAVPFDPGSLTIGGGPVPLVKGISRGGGTMGPDLQISMASDGTLAYIPSRTDTVTTAPARTLVWVDREGREEAITGCAPASVRSSPSGSGRDAPCPGNQRRKSEPGYLGLGLRSCNTDEGDVGSRCRQFPHMDT